MVLKLPRLLRHLKMCGNRAACLLSQIYKLFVGLIVSSTILMHSTGCNAWRSVLASSMLSCREETWCFSWKHPQACQNLMEKPRGPFLVKALNPEGDFSHREQHTIQGTRGTSARPPSGSTRRDISMVVTATSRFATKQHVVTQAQLALQPTHCLLHRAALCATSRSCDAVAYIIEPGEISGNWVDSWNSSHNRGGCCHKGAQCTAATVIRCMARA